MNLFKRGGGEQKGAGKSSARIEGEEKKRKRKKNKEIKRTNVRTNVHGQMYTDECKDE